MTDKTPMPAMSVRHLKKTFGDRTVVDDVSFDIYPGEVVALVGENGAGKSTTKNMLCGLLRATSGTIMVEGEEVQNIHGQRHGIAAVHQELSLFQSLTVAENLCVGHLPGGAMNVDWRETSRIAKEQLDFLGIDIDVDATVSSLGAGQQQIVEIAKALLRADKLLILDEPTTSLTAPERQKLFAIMEKLTARGVAIVFISHFMDEIYKAAQKYIVLRDGKQVGAGPLKEVKRAELEQMMVGREIGSTRIDVGQPQSEEALRVEKLSSYDFHDISFSVRKGEILGVAGLMGAGRTEVMEAIFGIRPSQGAVFVGGQKVEAITVAEMKRRGVCYVPEDRREHGLFAIRSVRENISAANIAHFVKRRFKWFGFAQERERTNAVVRKMNVSIPHMEAPIGSLSGGNQQKVLLGRWLAAQPDICILDEPTKGVDIGAKFDIHTMIADLAKSGMAVIIVSSDLLELLDTAHRIMVMRSGHAVGEFARADFDAVKIISMAASSAFDTGKAA